MSIPKIIHYCWFGNNPLPEKVQNCIKSWKKYCPEYEIIQWNEKNYDVHKNQYIEEAYQTKKWAFVSDYARLDVVYQYGGIYLDTDVELIQNPDDLLKESLFLAIEKHNCQIATGLGFGAEKRNIVLEQIMNLYNNMSFIKKSGQLNLTACSEYVTQIFLKKGFLIEDKTQRIDNTLILSSEYFCPMNFHTGIVSVTDNTVGIHWYEASWYTKTDKHIHNVEMNIRKKFPRKTGTILCGIYRKSYRFIEYSKKGILLNELRERIREYM